jgi:hypothetical protein
MRDRDRGRAGFHIVRMLVSCHRAMQGVTAEETWGRSVKCGVKLVSSSGGTASLEGCL